jgi:hypothetical protein
MKTISLKITNHEIKTACRKDSKNCMIADSLRNHFPEAQYIKVDTQSIQFSLPRERRRYKFLTPRIGQVNILRFDKGLKVKPFQMTLVDYIVRPMGWARNHPNSPSRKGKKYRKTGKKRIIARREREFGLRVLVE